MLQYLLLFYALAHFSGLTGGSNTDVDEDKELLLAFVVHRHGERTPDEDEYSLSNEKEKFKEYIDIHGFEGLTNMGKARVYKLGKFLRERYGPTGRKLISSVYHHDDIYLRSTDKERTKMTATIAMSALYPPEEVQQWDEGLGKIWQPVPYTSVPLAEDYLRYYSNCKRFKSLMTEAKTQSIHEELAQYMELNTKIKAATGRDFRENPTMYQTFFDLLRSQLGLGLSVPQWTEEIMPQLADAARLAYRLYFRTEEMKKIGGGVMLNDFIQAANDIIVGKEVKKRFHVYSSHDFNVGSFIEVSKVTERENVVPEYAALFGLELYRTKSTGEYSVLPVYLPQAGSSLPKLLHIDGCAESNYCKYDKFLSNSEKYRLPERQYYQICGIRTELGY